MNWVRIWLWVAFWTLAGAAIVAYLATGHTAAKQALIVLLGGIASLGFGIITAFPLVWVSMFAVQRDDARGTIAALQGQVAALEERRSRRDDRAWLRDHLASLIQDGGTLLYAGWSLAPDEIDAWITDVHNYQDQTSEWVDEHLGYAECIRFRDLHAPVPPYGGDVEPVNHHHAEHMRNVHVWVHNLRGILADYPPIEDRS